jgi:hypothetical protein
MGEGELTEHDDPSRFHRVLGDAIAALEGAAVPYVLFGSIAASVYGKPEKSGDIDLLIEPAQGSARRSTRCQVPGSTLRKRIPPGSRRRSVMASWWTS